MAGSGGKVVAGSLRPGGALRRVGLATLERHGPGPGGKVVVGSLRAGTALRQVRLLRSRALRRPPLRPNPRPPKSLTSQIDFVDPAGTLSPIPQGPCRFARWPGLRGSAPPRPHGRLPLHVANPKLHLYKGHFAWCWSSVPPCRPGTKAVPRSKRRGRDGFPVPNCSQSGFATFKRNAPHERSEVSPRRGSAPLVTFKRTASALARRRASAEASLRAQRSRGAAAEVAGGHRSRRRTRRGGPLRCEASKGPERRARTERTRSEVSGLGSDAVRQLRYLVVDGAALGHQAADLAVGMHDGGVVAAAELLADLR